MSALTGHGSGGVMSGFRSCSDWTANDVKLQLQAARYRAALSGERGPEPKLGVSFDIATGFDTTGRVPPVQTWI